MSEQQGRMTEEGFERLSLKGECLSAETMMLVAEARRARASEASLLAEREDLIKALAERRRCFDYLLVEHHKRYCSGPLETCILADCCEAREAIANADALTRVRAHDEGTTT